MSCLSGSHRGRTALCDESGVCEIIEEENGGAAQLRCFSRGQHAIAMVDIAPLAVGHCLVLSRDHVTSTLDLAAPAFAELWGLADELAVEVGITLGGNVMVLEHGLRAQYSGPSCVRHAHVHVCPVASAEFAHLRHVLDANLANWRLFDSREAAIQSIESQPQYMLGYLGRDWFAGAPNTSVRQVTRATLADLVDTPPSDVDWYLGVGNPFFARTLELARRALMPVGGDHGAPS